MGDIEKRAEAIKSILRATYYLDIENEIEEIADKLLNVVVEMLMETK